MKFFSICPRGLLLAAALTLPSVPALADGEAHEPAAEHVDQSELYELVADGRHRDAFELAFEDGDELFETVFNSLDGVGAYVSENLRFSRVPRADLSAAGEWASHFPRRATGPNAQACNECHNKPFDDGAGAASSNVHRDPTHSGSMGSVIIRNTPHLFAPGAIQVLAEEMTERLHQIRADAATGSCSLGKRVTKTLSAKGVGFGSISATPITTSPCAVDFDVSAVVGVGADLVIRPFQWKGSRFSLRDFNRDAGHNELGMQAVEIAGDDADGDFDGVTNELTIGDMTALTVYLAAQPRPTTRTELAALGLIPALASEERAAIDRGGQVFQQVGCATCHQPVLTLERSTFREPSRNASYRDATFPAGQNPVERLVDPNLAVSFDLTRDQPDNRIQFANGQVYRLGSLRTDRRRKAMVELFGDLKHHEMGPGLAEAIDETGTGASVWLTAELWGVGSTAPYLHDGRATTLSEAILAHGGEAETQRTAFASLPVGSQKDLIAFLDNLVLFKVEEEE